LISRKKIFFCSFEHEVWQQGNGIRLVLLIDFWHPDLSKSRRNKMSPLPIDEGKISKITSIF